MILRLLALFLLLPGLAWAQVQPRLVRITQVDRAGAALGATTELFCPASGCQQPLSIKFENQTEAANAAIDVVARGLYIALEPRSIGTKALMDFNTGRPGPTFVTTRGRERIVATLPFIVIRDASVRAERGFDPEKQITEGAVFNRNREPDIYLKVEVLVADG